jgi:hypothetical protein
LFSFPEFIAGRDAIHLSDTAAVKIGMLPGDAVEKAFRRVRSDLTL